MKYIVLYNPLVANNTGKKRAERLKDVLKDDELEFYDVTSLNLTEHIKNFPSEPLILAGGDGTLNRFINSVDTDTIKNDIYLYPCGTGNDFASDVAPDVKNGIIKINEYVKNLPSALIKGKKYKFINGIGYGIDGYCCEVADKQRASGFSGDINYSSIAVKGLLFHYKPRTLTINVDGREEKFKHVWIAPVMNGRMYGGGMIPTPSQKRIPSAGEEKKFSLMVMHGRSKLAILILFPNLFKGTHIKNKKHIKVFEGKHIKVSYDRPAPCQVDGETILDVPSVEV